MNQPVVVIGAGPAGLTGASELRRQGIESVIVVDREEEVGGIPRHSDHWGFGLRDLHRLFTGPRYADRLAHIARDEGVVIRSSTTADLDPSTVTVTLTSASGREQLDAAAVLIATGARERPRSARLVAGDRGPGMFTTGQLQQWLIAKRPVGSRALIVGAEHVSYSALLSLRQARVTVVGLVTELPHSQSVRGVGAAVRALWGVPTWTSTRLLSLEGRPRIQRALLEDITTGQQRLLEVDTVIFTGDWIPDNELARRAGLLLDPGTKGPATDASGRSSRTGIYAAGNVLHPVETADRCAQQARRIARALASDLGLDRFGPPSIPLTVQAPLAWIWPNRITPGALTPTFLRLEQFTKQRRVVALQAGRPIGAARLSHGTPGQHLRVSPRLLHQVKADAGEVTVLLDS